MNALHLSQQFLRWTVVGTVVLALGLLLALPMTALAGKGGGQGGQGGGSGNAGAQGDHGYGGMTRDQTIEQVHTREQVRAQGMKGALVQDQDKRQDRDQLQDRDRDQLKDKDQLEDPDQLQDRDRSHQ